MNKVGCALLFIVHFADVFLEVADLVFTIVFTLEMLLKIVLFGFVGAGLY